MTAPMKEPPMRTKLVILLFLLLAFFALLACPPPSHPNHIRISVNSWVGFGPLYVAQEKGLFQANGLTAEIVKMENAPDRRAALISKRIDVLASTLDDLAVALSQGVDAAAFSCADFSNGGDGIIAAKGITSLKQLVDKEIAVQPGFVNHFFLLYVLRKNGLPIDGLQLNPMTPDDAGAAFLTGSVDAAVTWEPHLSEGLSKRPGSTILANSSQYPEAILDLFVASRDWIETNPEVVGKFRKTWDDALEYMRTHREEALLIISKELGIEPTEAGEMLGGAKLLNGDGCRELLTPSLATLAKDVEEIWSAAGYVTSDIDLEAAVKLQ